jgi:hypothetical protein
MAATVEEHATPPIHDPGHRRHRPWDDGVRELKKAVGLEEREKSS